MLQLLFLSSECGLPLAVSEVTILGAQAKSEMGCWGRVQAAAASSAAVLQWLPFCPSEVPLKFIRPCKHKGLCGLVSLQELFDREKKEKGGGENKKGRVSIYAYCWLISLFKIRCIFLLDLSDIINHCGKHNVHSSIHELLWDQIHLQFWIQNLSWNWTAASIEWARM